LKTPEIATSWNGWEDMGIGTYRMGRGAFRENAFRENAFRENAFREGALREKAVTERTR
jgi:hypothetical protein